MAILTTDVKNANVKFLNGLQRNVNDLITNGGATKGAFYLTSDTHRLYIGQEDNTHFFNNRLARFLRRRSCSEKGRAYSTHRFPRQ